MDLLNIYSKTITGLVERMQTIFNSIWGWACSTSFVLLTSLLGWLGDTREMCIYLVGTAIILDLFWGGLANFKQGTFILSSGITKTCIKSAVYASILLVFLLIEKAINDDWTIVFRIATALLLTAEGISIFSHILIIKPNTPVINLLWNLLSSEIAKKLGVEKSVLNTLYPKNSKLNEIK